MMFWFNTDVGQAFPGISAPQNRQIQLQLENYSSIVYKESPIKIKHVMKQYNLTQYDSSVVHKQDGWMQPSTLTNYAAWLLAQTGQHQMLFQNQKYYVLSMVKLSQTVQLYNLLDLTQVADQQLKAQYDSLTMLVNVTTQQATSLTLLNQYVTANTSIDRTKLSSGQFLQGFKYVYQGMSYPIFLIDDIQSLSASNVQNIVQDDNQVSDYIY